jgi:hypothetical protein
MIRPSTVSRQSVNAPAEPTARRKPSSTDTGGTQPSRVRALEIPTCKLPPDCAGYVHRLYLTGDLHRLI